MSALKVGDRIRDNDPRMRGRILTILAIDDAWSVKIDRPSRNQWVHISRIHTDGKPRRSGFDLVTTEGGTP